VNPRSAAIGLALLLCAAAYPQAADLKSEVDDLKARVRLLERELQELRQLLVAKAAPVPRQPVADGGSQSQQDAPISIRVGSAEVTPYGFFDVSATLRDKTIGCGMPTNFGAVPLRGTVEGRLGETRITAQNSRLGFRLEAPAGGAKLAAMFEIDFLGSFQPNTPVIGHAYGPRLRQFWAGVRTGRIEFLGGQAWSLLTPNRRGLSPYPPDVFLTQDLDPNLQVGLLWSRSPQFRVVYHATEKAAFGVSVEAAEQYGGGVGGAGVITLPSALAAAYANQVHSGGSAFGTPNPGPDIIAKAAFDPTLRGRAAHIEFAGLLSRFAFYNPLSGRRFHTVGGGGSLNAGFELFRNFRVYTNNFLSSGGGRWIYAQGPNLVIQEDGSPSLVRAGSTVDGVEYQPSSKWQVFAYYGGAYFGRNVVLDPSASRPVGFGYSGSPTGHNRVLHEATGGASYTFFRNPASGAVQFITQYSYLRRSPWFAAERTPRFAQANMLYLTFRYVLPGSPRPSF